MVDQEPMIYSESLFCPDCGISMPEIKPQLFSFYTPIGSCPACNGLGYTNEFTEDMIFPDKSKSMYNSGLSSVGGFGNINSYSWKMLDCIL